MTINIEAIIERIDLEEEYKIKIKNSVTFIESQLPKYFSFGRTKKSICAGLLWFAIVYNSDILSEKTKINPLWYVTLMDVANICNSNEETIRRIYKEISSFLNLENLMKLKLKNKLSKMALSNPLSPVPSSSSKDYRELRNKILSENLVCSYCGENAKEVNLIIHHKDGNRNNNDINNLEVICTACHFYNGHPNPKAKL